METGTPRCVAESLTLDALLKTEPPETIASWLRGSATYLTNPRASRAGAVTAVVVLKDSDVTHEVTVGLFSNGRYFASCKTCGGYYRCAGANVLFADLAISGTLRN
ncbi:MAG: hypothetical protein MUF54_18985, partial [Polyangiaceae bacterium]|nr:hypothetical protein [Polyangiaceae bacterium]